MSEMALSLGILVNTISMSHGDLLAQGYETYVCISSSKA